MDKTAKVRVAHGIESKVDVPESTPSAVEMVTELSMERKVLQMPKGWVYVDEGMEKIRFEEARKDKQIACLQKKGVLPATFRVEQPKIRTRSSGGEGKVMRLIRTTKLGMPTHRTKATPRALDKKF